MNPGVVQTYAALADPRLKGQVCMRSSSAIYNLSLLGALIAHWGADKAEAWVKGVVANFARPPQGNDTSLLKSVAAGECGVTIANHYYYLRLKDGTPDERAAAAALSIVFPDQARFRHPRERFGRGRDGARAAPARGDPLPGIHGGDRGPAHPGDRQSRISGRGDGAADAGAGTARAFQARPDQCLRVRRKSGAAQAIFDKGGWR